MKLQKRLRKENIRLKKSLGQNFLINKDIANKIVKIANINGDEKIIEIGMGSGMLTREIVKYGVQVVVFEVDLSLKQLHKDIIQANNVKIYYKDFLKYKLENIESSKIKYIANIPYNITSPILEKILFNGPDFILAVLMVQKEFAERIIAEPGSKAYGALTVKMNTFSNIQKVMSVSRKNFFPEPNVDSSVLKLTMKVENVIPFEERKKFNRFINLCFSHRRKQLKNNLKGLIDKPEEFIAKYGIEPKARAEELDLEQFISLFEGYQRVVK
ncbi:MAG: 16S rRNA (adenine(1518)-N(6)/adenine(1519)-N(6))-dimethyltransferase RsmA [Kosmotogaceae bacterium]